MPAIQPYNNLTIQPYHHTTLFLDRDGVINRRLENDYVKTWQEFSFLPGVLQAMPLLASKYSTIVVVTNQQGIGKGLMTEADLKSIHHQMLQAIEAGAGRVDGVFFCPHLAKQQCNCRKPQPGMAIQAQSLFPHIDFQRSVMVGDSSTDIEFGRKLGMTTVLIGGKHRGKADWLMESLLEFSGKI